MGLRGPAPKPLAIRIAEGTATKAEANAAAAPASIAGAPEGLMLHGPEAVRVWEETAASMATVPGWLTVADERTLFAYCVAWQQVHDAQTDINENGIVLHAMTGTAYQNPAVAVKNAAMNMVAKLARELGLSPTSRPAKLGQSGAAKPVRRRQA